MIIHQKEYSFTESKHTLGETLKGMNKTHTKRVQDVQDPEVNRRKPAL